MQASCTLTTGPLFQYIPKTHKHKRKDLLNDMRDKRNDYMFVLEILPKPFQLKRYHVISTPFTFTRQEPWKVFIPIIGFQRVKSLEDILVRVRDPI